MTNGLSVSDNSSCVGDYRLVRELGRGGMGIVYEALEPAMSRRVALKMLPPAAALDLRQLARFRAEALAGGQLDHPHIVPVYSVNCQDDTHFYTMKYIEGCSLKELLDELRRAASCGQEIDDLACRLLRNPLSPDAAHQSADHPATTRLGDRVSSVSPSSHAFFRRVAELGIQAAEALNHSHARGIIHGDIKPANLLLDATGLLWLTDFGSAWLTSDSQPDQSPSFGGTLRYLSPEQARGDVQDLDQRTDIYSLGATLFELATQSPAVAGNSPVEILSAVAYESAPLARDRNPAVPTLLESILGQAMANDPNQRYASAAELSAELRHFLNGDTVHARSTSTPTSRGAHPRFRRAALLAATLLVLVCVVPWSFLGRSSNASRPDTDTRQSDAADNSEYRWHASLASAALVAKKTSAGNRREAEKQINASVAVLESLRDTQPDNPDYSAGLAWLHLCLGDLLAGASRHEEESHLRHAMALLEPMAQESLPLRSNPFYSWTNAQDALAECRIKLHGMYCSDGNDQMLFPVLEYLSADPAEPLPGDVAEWRERMLAEAERSLGTHLAHRGRHADSQHYLRRSIERYEQLRVKDPDVVECRYQQGMARFELAELLSALGDECEAAEQRTRVHDLFTELVRDWPNVADFHHFLAGNLNNLTMHDPLPGDEVVKQLEVAVEHEQTAIRLDTENLDYRRYAVIQLGNLVQKTDDPDRAATASSQAIVHQNYLVQHAPSDAEARRCLADVLNSNGLLMLSQHRLADAQDSLEGAVREYGQVVEQLKRRPSDVSWLGGALNNLARTHLARGDHHRARTLIGEAIMLQEEALRAEPENSQFQSFLTNHHATLDDLNQMGSEPVD